MLLLGLELGLAIEWAVEPLILLVSVMAWSNYNARRGGFDRGVETCMVR